jgi:hypothetical protein
VCFNAGRYNCPAAPAMPGPFRRLFYYQFAKLKQIGA